VINGTLTPPFHVTHLDAHADLGLGDAGYRYLMSSLLFEPPERRTHPRTNDSGSGLTDGNFLLFAIACRWIGDLVYVFGDGGGGDELPYVMQGFARGADHVQLAAMEGEQVDRLLRPSLKPTVAHLEPAVPYRSTPWRRFDADGAYDLVCLTRSPPYTPAAADQLFSAIRDTYIEPIVPAGESA
jgi:hypothetical protein